MIKILELRSVRGTGGGPEKTILLGAGRATPGYAVTVCYLRDARDPVFAIGARPDCTGVDYLELAERSSFDPRIWPALQRLVRDRAIDIVHGHDYKTDLLALMLSKTSGIVPLATAHGWTGHSSRERWLYYPADKRVLRRLPITIAVSSEIRSELIDAGVAPERVRVVLNGIDHRVFRRDPSRREPARAAFGLRREDVVVGAAGRLEPQKRFDLLIRACADLRRRRPNLRLLIAGEGSSRPELEALGRELLPADAFTLLGHQSEVVSLHHAIDLFVQSSDYEGTSNAVLEAMALETPIVATAAGGTAEMIGDGVHGLIVPIGNATAIADAIERTLSEPSATAARVHHARRRVETDLSFDARMARLEGIYDELMHRRRQSEPRRTAERCA